MSRPPLPSGRHIRRSLLYSSAAAALAACLFQGAPVAPQVAKDSAAAGPVAPRSAPARDSVLEQRVARLELRLAERDAQIEDLQARLDEARQEVVRAMAKLQTVASRAEAASAIVAGASRSRLGGAGRPPLRPGEVSFAVPVRLRATVRSKVREGPGAAYKVLFTVEPGAGLVGYSYVERWVRVGDESGRAGWMFLNLVGRRPTGPGGR